MPRKRKEGKELLGGYVPVELKRALFELAKMRSVTVSDLLNEMAEDFVDRFRVKRGESADEKGKN